MSTEVIETDKEQTEVGIETYLNDGPAFTAIIKQRFVDFIVREITLDEEVVRLTDISTVPQEKSTESVFDKTKSTEECMTELVGTEEAKSFSAFSATPFEKDKPEANKFTFNWNGTKEERIRFHTLIKERFEHMDSNTSGGKLTVTKLPENKKREERWPKDRPPYLSFVLYKENLESVVAIKQLADITNAKTNRFTIAGNKDKRGITSQRCTCYKLDAEKLISHNIKVCQMLQKRSSCPSLLLTGNYQYVDTPLTMGKLKGNRFTLTLRAVHSFKESDYTTLAKKCVDYAQKGFVNYFGLQRFGTALNDKCKTHLIGAAILKGEWEHAAELIILSKDKDGKATELFKAKNYQECLSAIPYYLTAERELVRSMIKCGKSASCRNAIGAIPAQTRQIYLHAFCSFVFNKCATYRLSLGKDVIVGDFVRVPSSATNTCSENSKKRKREEHEAFPSVHEVTEEDVSTHKYTLYDIVLPLPGSLNKYPTNKVCEYYDQVISELGLSREALRHLPQQFNITGDYREVVQRASDVTCDVKTYDEEFQQMAETDRDVLVHNGKVQECAAMRQQKRQKQAEGDAEQAKTEDAQTAESTTEKAPETQPQKLPQQQTAFVLSFSLPKGSYATMLYRELFKQSTSSAHQKGLAEKTSQTTEDPSE